MPRAPQMSDAAYGHLGQATRERARESASIARRHRAFAHNIASLSFNNDDAVRNKAGVKFCQKNKRLRALVLRALSFFRQHLPPRDLYVQGTSKGSLPQEANVKNLSPFVVWRAQIASLCERLASRDRSGLN